ncbi:hypothetical protein HRbin02_00952 [Candidatus Calditenuaceae archaeon HR02]|nr:hypothetical protein HRbin02_00952 [Candidatus Calditenuaceae archaeon HR02]
MSKQINAWLCGVVFFQVTLDLDVLAGVIALCMQMFCTWLSSKTLLKMPSYFKKG